MNNDFANAGSNHSAFHQTYLRALQAVMAYQDELANGLINKTRRLLSSPVEDEAVRMIQEELTPQILNRLHGDYKYENANASPWIMCPTLHSMIRRHVEILGTEQDAKDYKDFAQRCSQTFGKPYVLSSHDLKIA